jgi:hypothetical protein
MGKKIIRMGLKFEMDNNKKITIEVQDTAIEFLGLWEKLSHPDFKSLEFDGIRMQVVLNNSTLIPKLWIEKTGAIGVASYELKPLDGFLKGLGYLI